MKKTQYANNNSPVSPLPLSLTSFRIFTTTLPNGLNKDAKVGRSKTLLLRANYTHHSLPFSMHRAIHEAQ